MFPISSVGTARIAARQNVDQTFSSPVYSITLAYKKQVGNNQDEAIVRSCKELQETCRNDKSRSLRVSNNNVYVKKFPAWERFVKLPSNGLVHAATQQTAPDGTAQGSSFIAELGTVPYTTTTNQRATFPIAVMANGRGVSLKEIAAVAQGGASYNPQEIESQGAMTKLASDAQWAMMQGNATNAGGLATQEAGLYNALAFDGYRGVLGSVSAFAGNNAYQMDISGLNMLESLQTVAVHGANNGGNPTLVMMSMLAKQALDIEQENNVRYNSQLNDLIPGVKSNAITYANGSLDIAPIPGNSIGTYNRTSDGVLVEDMYVLDESTIKIRWLYSPDFVVMQIPSGVDGQLSDRVIIFGMYGLEQAAPIFCGKARRVAS